MKSRYLIALLALTTLLSCQPALADKIIFKNYCKDIDPVKPDWTCLNESQAAQTKETIEQIKLARKNTNYKRGKIISVDPMRYSRGVWEYGAWYNKGKIYFAAMPGCPNARWELEQLFLKLRRGINPETNTYKRPKYGSRR
jgi:hypothetical protein